MTQGICLFPICLVLQHQHFAPSFQLVDMQWKLGMAMSSDTCRSLYSPYVSVRLKIIEPSGQIGYKSFEMTIPQFQVSCCSCERSVDGVTNACLYSEMRAFYFSLQNLQKQFKEMAAVMETV